MIIEFKVSNFKSIKREQVLSFVASGIKEMPRNCVDIKNEDLKLLKTTTMYGANASGKSNLIDSIEFFRSFILKSFKESEKSDIINTIPFLLSNETNELPSSFEMSFTLNTSEIVTYGFSVSRKEVKKEYLYINDKQYFEREKTNFFFIKEHKEKWEIRAELLNSNSLFLSLLASTNDDIGISIFEYIKENIVVFSALRSLNDFKTIELMQQGAESSKKILESIKIADLGIKNLEISEKEIDETSFEKLPPEIKEKAIAKKKYNIATSHNLLDKNGNNIGEVQITEGIKNFESIGTKQFIAMIGHVFDAMDNGKTLFIDELGAQFHPVMSRYIINMFNSQKNTSGQLFFTTHDVTNLSSELFRRDQIWFAEKDKLMATSFYSLVDYKVNNSKIRNDENYAKNYMQGKYGAIPFINYNNFDFYNVLHGSEGEELTHD